MFYPRRDAGRVPDRTVQVGADAGPRDAVQVVAQPVHGLRAPLHVLLRPALRAARRPAVGRPLRSLDPREVERRRGPAAGARAPVVAARGGRARHCDRSLPAGRGAVPADARVPRRARRVGHGILDRDARPARRARCRPPRRRSSRGARERLPLPAHARRPRLADDRARHGAAGEQAARDPRARRRRHRRRRRAGADPARDLRRRGAAAGRRRAAREAGARTIWASAVHLRPGVREHFLAALARDWPDQVERYEALFGTRAYLPAAVARSIVAPAHAARDSARPTRRRPLDPEPRQLALAV